MDWVSGQRNPAPHFFTWDFVGSNSEPTRVQDKSANPYQKPVDEIRSDGWCVLPDFLRMDVAADLYRESLAAWEKGEFRRAGVGRGTELVVREDVRTDLVMWLREGELSVCQQHYFALLEELRMEFNRNLFLGLLDFEGHFAVYPEGGFYKPHLDRHRGTEDRLVTVILYLNPKWQPGDGGELKIRTTPGEKAGEFFTVEPRMGTLVCFLAGDFWHEVLPARKTRASITGWFRGR